MAEPVRTIKWFQKQVKKLRDQPQPVQRSKEWFDLRKNRITASEVSCCLYENEYTMNNYIQTFNLQNNYKKLNPKKGCNSYTSEYEFIVNKCGLGLPYRDTPPTLWGKKYEEIANNIYKRIKNTDVIEFGLLPHSKLNWLGASPDGITPNGVMLEIKCPKSRQINNVPPFYYWAQVQIQLETCNLQECDFLQCELIEINDEHEFLLKNTIQYEKEEKGILIEKILVDSPEIEPSFIYPPVPITEPEDFINWSNQQIEELKNDPTIVSRKIYYKLVKYTLITVQRDPVWFKNVKKDIKIVFNKIQKYRKDDCKEIREKQEKDKHRDPVACMITDDNSTDEDHDVDMEEDILSVESKCIIDNETTSEN